MTSFSTGLLFLRRAYAGLTLLVMCTIACGAVAGCSEVDKQKATMKITNHPHYDSLKAFKKAHEIDFLKKYDAHGIGIRWEDNVDESNAANGNKKIVLALYVSSVSEEEDKIPNVIFVQNVNGDGELRISVQTIVSPQASFD